MEMIRVCSQLSGPLRNTLPDFTQQISNWNASEIISCVKDKNKKIISGNPDKVKKVYDTWKFSKDIRSPNPNWFLKETD